MRFLFLLVLTAFFGVTYGQETAMCPWTNSGGSNLVTNGDFSAGNSGFTSDYTLGTPTLNGGEYAVDNDAQTYNAGFFRTPGNHGNAGFPAGNFFLADGGNSITDDVYSTSVNVVAGNTYIFSVWVANIHVSYDNPSEMSFEIDGTPIGSLLADGTSNDWQQFYSLWTATSTGAVTISLRNLTTGTGGNDMGIDDVFFTRDCDNLVNYDITTNLVDTVFQCGVANHTFETGLSAAQYDFEWKTAPATVIGAAADYTTSTAGTYFVCIDPTGLGCPVTDTTTLFQAIVPTVGGGAINCGTNTADFTASVVSGPSDFHWYDEMTGGNEVGTGTPFTTPVIACGNETYYLENEAVQISSIGSVSYPETGHGLSGGNSASSGNDRLYVEFDATSTFTLDSMTVGYYPYNNTMVRTLTFQVFEQGTNNPVSAAVTSNVSGPSVNGPVNVRIAVGLTVPAGNGYYLRVTGGNAAIHWYQNGGTYPRDDGAVVFTSQHSSLSWAPNSFPTFLDWAITELTPCPRVAATTTSTCGGVEDCSNGVDDDCDGLIDCYDTECIGTCGDFYYGAPPPLCQVVPTVDPNFGLDTVWNSNILSENRSDPIVGDVDGDGVPEVIMQQWISSGVAQLAILDGATGRMETLLPNPSADLDQYQASAAIADVDDDGTGEIFAVYGDRKIYRFEHDGTIAWSTVVLQGGTTTDSPERWPVAIADFDGDGTPEVYSGNEIFNSITGALIASGGTGNSQGHNATLHAMAVAADVLPDSYCANCAGLELVAGDQVYSVDIGGGALNVESSTNQGDGMTSIADWNCDGELDICVARNGGKIYVWDPRLATADKFITNACDGSPLGPMPVTLAGNSGPGSINIADFDGDGAPELGAAGSDIFEAYDNNMTQMWSNVAQDQSNVTSSSTFDFEGDGNYEIVYRDEVNLYIYEGATGAIRSSYPCESGTRFELPIVVDVNGDGEANIVCTCGDNYPGINKGQIFAFTSNTNTWVKTRQVWNQHSYNPVMIGDDLSVPTSQQNHAIVPGHNIFQSNTPFTDLNGDIIFKPLPDLQVVIDSVPAVTCGGNTVAYITVTNAAPEETFPTSVDVAFYNGDPNSGGVLIGTDVLTSANTTFIDGDTRAFSYPVSMNAYDLYVVINDDGSNPGSAPVIQQGECDSTNNIVSETINCPVSGEVRFRKTVSPTNALPGDTVTYSFKITNTTGANVNNITFSDDMADNRVITSGPTNLLGGTVTGGTGVGQNNIEVTGITAPAGDSFFDIEVEIPCDAVSSSLSNQAELSNLGGLGPIVVSDDTTTVPVDDATAIAIGAFPAVGATGQDPSDCVTNDGEINITGLTSGLIYTIEYTIAASLVTEVDHQVISATTYDITGLAQGTYEDVSVYLNGCLITNFGDIVLTTPGAPATPTAGSNGPVCEGEILNVDATGVAGNYTWAGPNSFASALEDPQVSASATTAMSGEYKVVVEVGGCTSDTGRVTVVVNSKPTITASSYNNPVCEDQSLELSSSGPVGNFAWIGPLGYTSALEDPTVSASATTAMSGDYKVVVEVLGCTSDTSTVSVMIGAKPSVTGTSSNGPVCEGEALDLSVTGPAGNFAWIGPNSFTSATEDPQVSASATTAMSGEYKVVVELGGCTSDTGRVTVVVNAKPTITASGYNSPLCEGESLELSSTGTAGNFAWIGPLTYSSALEDPTVSANATSAMSGDYKVVVEVAGCTSDTSTVPVTIGAKPTITGVSNNGPLCEGVSLDLTSTGPVGNYSWIGPSAFSSAIQNPNVTGSAVTGDAGDYKVVVEVGGCTSDTAITNVTVNATPTLTSVNNDSPICEGGDVNLSSVGDAGTYFWSGPNAYSSSSTDPVLNGLALADSGDYTLWIESNGCYSDTLTTNVAIDENPTTSDAGTSNSFCSATATLAANTALVGTGIWNALASSTGGTIDDPSQRGSSVSGINPGECIDAEWVISNGVCPDSKDTVTLCRLTEIVPNPTLTVDFPEYCEGDDIVYRAVGNTSGTFEFVDDLTGLTLLGPSNVDSLVISGATSDQSVKVIFNATACVAAGSTNPVETVPVNATVYLLPDAGVIDQSAFNTCADCEIVTSASVITNGTVQWSVIAGSGLVSTSNDNSAEICSLALNDTTVVEMRVSNGVCPVELDTVAIYRQPQLTLADAGSDLNLCESSALPGLTGSVPAANETAVWNALTAGSSIDAAGAVTSWVAGLNQFEYIISNGSCDDKDTIDILVVAMPDAATLTGADSIPTCTDELNLTAQSPTPAGATGMWSVVSSPGIPVIQSSSNPTSLLSSITDGLTVMRWKVMNGQCIGDSVELKISKLGSITAPTMSIDGGAYSNMAITGTEVDLCINENYVLTSNSPAVDESAQWNLLAGTSISLGDPITSTTQSLVLNSEGITTLEWEINKLIVGQCPSGTKTVDFNVLGLPDASGNVISSTGASPYCEGDADAFVLSTPLTNGTATSYQWTLMDGSTQTTATADLGITFSGALAISGNIFVTPINGCGVGTPSPALNVVVNPTVVPQNSITSTIADGSTICPTESLTLDTTAMANLGINPSFQWLDNALPIIGETGVQLAFGSLSLGNHVYALEVTVSPEVCTGTSTLVSNDITLTVEDYSIDITAESALCEGALETATSVTTNVASVEWFTNNGSIGNQTSVSMSGLTAADNQLYAVATPSILCSSEPTKQSSVIALSISETPVASLAESDMTICIGDDTLLTALGGSAQSTYQWFDNSSGTPVQVSGATNSTLAISSSGSYFVTITNQGICSQSSASSSLTVLDVQVEGMASPDVIEQGESVNLIVVSPVGAYSYVWEDIMVGVPIAGSNVLDFPLATTSYVVVAEQGGCYNSDTVEVGVRLPVVIPNVITVNSDGVNDVWNIEGLETYEQVAVRIYNRWGNLIHEDYGSYTPWDGYRNGREMPVGTYYYVIEILDLEQEVFKGALNLIK